MASQSNPADERYDSLASPLKSIGSFTESSKEALLMEEGEVLNGITFKRIGTGDYRRGTATLRAGELLLIAGRTTPVESTNTSPAFEALLTMPFSGGFINASEKCIYEVGSGDVFLSQSNYGVTRRTCSSSIFVPIDAMRLGASMRVISGIEHARSLVASILIRGHGGRGGRSGASKLWSFIEFIDGLHGEDGFLPAALGLDEQFYRILAFVLLERAGRLGDVKDRQEKQAHNWTTPLDDLVDYIRANAHQNLTLTDLEERSNYSARRLQSLFKEKLNCSPIQFIRRQRLVVAMARLETAGWDDTVTTISRSAGYRLHSTFTRDFQREFGVNPSAVLRASRGGKHP